MPLGSLSEVALASSMVSMLASLFREQVPDKAMQAVSSMSAGAGGTFQPGRVGQTGRGGRRMSRAHLAANAAEIIKQEDRNAEMLFSGANDGQEHPASSAAGGEPELSTHGDGDGMQKTWPGMSQEELHGYLEMSFLFSLVWSVGGHLDASGRARFDAWLRSALAGTSAQQGQRRRKVA